MSFGWWSNTVTVDRNDQVKNDIFTNAINCKTYRVKDLVRLNNINVSEYVDCYKQTLLHIATWTNNVDLIKYLLEQGCNKYKKDIYGWTPVDNAIKMGNQEVIKLLFGTNEADYAFTVSENERLRRDNKSLLETNKLLENSLNTMQTKYDTVVVELSSERNHKKRLRDDNDEFMREAKRMKLDNEKLTKDNLDLQQTVNNLRGKK